MAAKFSAIVTNYNHGDYIADAVRSVLACDDPDSEVIVVDDGSTDHSAQALAPFQNNPQVKLIFQENGGQASAFNRGVKEAQGEILALFDGDDFWFPNKIRECRRMIAEFDLAEQHFYIRHPLTRVWEDIPADIPNDRLYFSTTRGRVTIPVGESGQVSKPEEVLADLKHTRYPAYLGGDFGGSTVAARKTIEAVYPLPDHLSKHFGDMYASMVVGFVSPVYALMKYLGAYRMHGANHSIDRPREPYEFWAGIGEYAQRVLDKNGINQTVNFDESVNARPYLIEQGRFAEVLAGQRARADAGSPYDLSLKGKVTPHLMNLRHKLRGSK